MNALQKALTVINNRASNLPAVQNRQIDALYNGNTLRPVGNEITFYPQDTGQRFIEKGYMRNDSIYSIVSKNARKFAQLRLYHRRAKKSEQKTLTEYFSLYKQAKDIKAVKELDIMRKAMTEDYAVDSKLARLLNRPNRREPQSDWLEGIFAYLELTGEADLLANRGIIEDGPPLELFLIPKQHLNLIIDPNDMWEVHGYELVIGTLRRRIDKDDLLMWAYPSVLPLDNPDHFRGQPPLECGAVLMQGMNEADERVAISNKNAGAAGLAYMDQPGFNPTAQQINDLRRQFNQNVNTNEMANKIAVFNGKWGYINFGYSVTDLKILEQYGLGFKRLCRVFNTPPGIFAEGNDTYENVRQYKRDWIFDKINPAMAGFRSLLQEWLIEDFGLDPERDFIDYDIMSLPELSTELSEQVKALNGADFLTPNEKRDYCGYERLPDANMDKVYVGSGITPLDELNMPTGGDMSNEMEDLA